MKKRCIELFEKGMLFRANKENRGFIDLSKGVNKSMDGFTSNWLVKQQIPIGRWCLISLAVVYDVNTWRKQGTYTRIRIDEDPQGFFLSFSLTYLTGHYHVRHLSSTSTINTALSILENFGKLIVHCYASFMMIYHHARNSLTVVYVINRNTNILSFH